MWGSGAEALQTISKPVPLPEDEKRAFTVSQIKSTEEQIQRLYTEINPGWSQS